MSYKLFINKDCEYYPCHNTDKPINCMFCYCPLYLTDCEGNFTMLPNGVKDCSNCMIPHNENSHDNIVRRLEDAIQRR